MTSRFLHAFACICINMRNPTCMGARKTQMHFRVLKLWSFYHVLLLNHVGQFYIRFIVGRVFKFLQLATRLFIFRMRFLVSLTYIKIRMIHHSWMLEVRKCIFTENTHYEHKCLIRTYFSVFFSYIVILVLISVPGKEQMNISKSYINIT